MPGNRDRKFVRGHAAAIVTYAYQPNATAFDINFYPMRTGIKAVFHELFDDRSRSLDDLAGGDLIDEFAGEDTDWHRRLRMSPGWRRGGSLACPRGIAAVGVARDDT